MIHPDPRVESAMLAELGATGEAIDRPAKPPTALDVQRAAMGRAMSRISA